MRHMGLGGWLRCPWKAVLPCQLELVLKEKKMDVSQEGENKLKRWQELAPPGTDGNFVSDLGGVGVCRTGRPSSGLRMLERRIRGRLSGAGTQPSTYSFDGAIKCLLHLPHLSQISPSRPTCPRTQLELQRTLEDFTCGPSK